MVSTGHYGYLQTTLASGIIIQMDQTKLKNKIFSWYE